LSNTNWSVIQKIASGILLMCVLLNAISFVRN
jgi:hypothetical protein